jgi:multiple sugar transport system ATP-binding protein
MAEVVLKGISKHFGAVAAVGGIDLRIEDKSFVCLVGPSGCGKTTTLRLIAGLERVSSGEIYFDGRRVDHLAANQRDIAMVFQSYALYPHMTVAQNIGFALRMMKVPAQEIDHRVHTTAQKLGVQDLLARKPRELSGGQRQRVALGRAMVRDAAVFLMDEPLSNLDAQLRVQTRAELKRLHAELARTFVYVTHDQAEAMTMADKIAVIHQGRLQQYASPNEIYGCPVNRFVASFLGSPAMNFLSGALERSSGRPRFLLGAQSAPIDKTRAGAVASGPIVLGVRPEALTLLPPAAASGLAGSVFIEEPLGSDLFVTVDVEGARVVARTTPDQRYEPGANVRLAWDPARIHLFHAESGEAIR